MEEKSNVVFVGHLFNWRPHFDEIFNAWKTFGPDEVVDSFVKAGMNPSVAKALLKRVIGVKFGGLK